MAAAVTMKRVVLFITDFYYWVSSDRHGLGDVPARAVWYKSNYEGYYSADA